MSANVDSDVPGRYPLPLPPDPPLRPLPKRPWWSRLNDQTLKGGT